MASASHIKALIQSHADGDDTRFVSIIIQIAAQEARRGNVNYAKQLRDMVQGISLNVSTRRSKDQHGSRYTKVDNMLSISVSRPMERIRDYVFSADIEARLRRLVSEHRRRDEICALGFTPDRSLLLTGPAGTGKRLSARVIAGDLGLPLYTMQLHRMHGEAGASIVDAIHGLDEQDALDRAVFLIADVNVYESSDKADNLESRARMFEICIGLALRSIPNGILVITSSSEFIESKSLLGIFDVVMEYSLPSRREAIAIAKARLTLLDSSGIVWSEVARAAEGLSQSEIVLATDHAAKHAILQGHHMVGQSDLLSALESKWQLRDAP